MKIAVFDTHGFEREAFSSLNKTYQFEIDYLDVRLLPTTAALSKGYDVICSFANDKVNAETLEILKSNGVKLLATRSAGFNHIDVKRAKALAIPVVRVPAYSPYSVAEHAIALILTLNRKTHKAYARVREGNFSLEGLVGFDLYGKTIGVIGTGKIGSIFCKIALGFGCDVIANDIAPSKELQKLGVQYVSLKEMYGKSDILSLHCPLTPETRHLLDQTAFQQMKPGVVVINTGRGALIDTHALIESLKRGHIGAAGLDVYEEEEGIFFNDLSSQVLQDDQLARLLTFPNVLITSHQAFLTREAIHNIVETTLKNIQEFALSKPLTNEIMT